MASSDILVRLRMTGQQAFQASAGAAARSLSGIGKASLDSSKDLGAFTKGAQGHLSTLMGFAGRGAGALAAAGVAAAGVGIKFNASMEQSKVAFTNLLGSSSEAQGMLDRLYKTAATTPFEFPQLVQSTQKLLGFGMAAEKVEPTMQAVGDAVAAAGGGTDQIDKVATALGQIQAKGKVSTEELMQMAESGVPAMKILADQMGITGADLSEKLRKGLIDADSGISALVTGIGKRYGGMAAAQSKTFNGMLSTLKDNATQTLGVLTGPLFQALSTRVLPKINEIAGAIQKWAKGGGPAQAINALRAGFAGKGPAETAGYTGALATIVKVGRLAGQGFQAIATYAGQFVDALKPAQPFLQNILLPLLKGIGVGILASIVGAFRLAIPIIRIIATVLGFLGEKLAFLKPVFFALGVVIGYLATGPFLKFLSGIKYLGLVVRPVLVYFRLIQRVLGLVGGAFLRVAGIVSKVLAAAFGKIPGLAGRVFSSLAGFPARLIGFFTRAVQGALRAVERLGGKAAEAGKSIVSGLVRGIKAAIGAGIGFAADIGNAIRTWINDHTPFGDEVKAGPIHFRLPALASGGTMLHGGAALVGERGPEVVSLPRGATVYPTPAISPMLAGGRGQTTAHFYLSNRLVATAVAQDTADQQARR
jgi:tape measure domain-containing protein